MSFVSVKCPNCGASVQLDSTRTEGYCSYCGSKIKLEDPNKLIIQGNVKIDSTGDLKNLYILARRAKDSENDENALKYYDMILLKDPNSWEANFYSVYFKALQCNGWDSDEAKNMANCLHTVIQLIVENTKDEDNENEAIHDVSTKTLHIAQIFFNAAKEYYDKFNDFSDTAKDAANKMCLSGQIAYRLGDCLYEQFGDKYTDLVVKSWSLGVNLMCLSHGAFATESRYILRPQIETAESYVSKIKQLSPKIAESYESKIKQLSQKTVKTVKKTATAPEYSGCCVVIAAILCLLAFTFVYYLIRLL